MSYENPYFIGCFSENWPRMIFLLPTSICFMIFHAIYWFVFCIFALLKILIRIPNANKIIRWSAILLQDHPKFDLKCLGKYSIKNAHRSRDSITLQKVTQLENSEIRLFYLNIIKINVLSFSLFWYRSRCFLFNWIKICIQHTQKPWPFRYSVMSEKYFKMTAIEAMSRILIPNISSIHRWHRHACLFAIRWNSF